jgi:hypothetical protein
VGHIEKIVRQNKADERRQQAAIRRQNNKRKADAAKAAVRDRIEKEAKAAQELTELRAKVRGYIKPLAKLTIATLAERRYPRAELSRQFARGEYYFGFFGPAVYKLERAEYAYWLVRPASAGKREMVLRRMVGASSMPQRGRGEARSIRE